MAAILTNGVLKDPHRAHLSAAVGAGALQGLWEHKGSRCTPANAAHSPPRPVGQSPPRARHAAPNRSWGFSLIPSASLDAASAARMTSSPARRSAADPPCSVSLSWRVSLSPRATVSLSPAAHTDAAAQPNPCPTHTQNISSSNLLSFQRKKYSRRGPPPSLPCSICHFLSPFAAQHFLPRHNW